MKYGISPSSGRPSRQERDPCDISFDPGYERSEINKVRKTKKHCSTLDRYSAFSVGFAFSFGHPRGAKGNFLVFSFFVKREILSR
jgi:hypothetical protein